MLDFDATSPPRSATGLLVHIHVLISRELLDSALSERVRRSSEVDATSENQWEVDPMPAGEYLYFFHPIF